MCKNFWRVHRKFEEWEDVEGGARQRERRTVLEALGAEHLVLLGKEGGRSGEDLRNMERRWS